MRYFLLCSEMNQNIKQSAALVNFAKTFKRWYRFQMTSVLLLINMTLEKAYATQFNQSVSADSVDG